MPADYHMHLERDEVTGPCRYTPERIAEYVEAARRRGVGEIGVSEHCHRFAEFAHVMEDLWRPEPVAGAFWLPGQFNHRLEQYVEAVLAARRRGLPVKLGIEVDYLPGREEELRRLLAPYPWDYVIGSVHFLDGWAIDVGPEYGWPRVDVDEAYRAYFARLRQAALSGLFDVLAHPDLIKKFGHRPSFDLAGEYEETAAALAAAGVAAEVSTAGWRKPVGEAYPHPDLLRVLQRRGVPICFGSDAHDPDEVALDFPRAVRLARSCGYTRWVRWEGRRPALVDLTSAY
ncbi:MAG: histidinol-phosphatase HisJ family protein [Thermaerobacter sp.]|nr:histidinol-phosphatase [Bacillota bacterium]REJ36772.1 MAG: histidinol-phosphatase [Bacillota bacterium]